MSQIANVEYFYKKCNNVLHTSYSNTSKQAINIEWLIAATNKVYRDIHKPHATQCRLSLSATFTGGNTGKIAVDTILVDKVVAYLSNFNKTCDTDCACSATTCTNCNCNCVYHCTCSGYTQNCSSSSACNCNCRACACNCGSNCDCAHHCNCNCGSNTECQCDCADYWNCNCNIVTNCTYHCECNAACGGNCAACECSGSNACDCVCACECSHNNSHNNGSHDNSGFFHNEGHTNGPSSHSNDGSSHDASVNHENDSCFIGSTLVTMSDGSKKRIDKIKEGDRVKTSTGEDVVVFVESGISPVWKIKFTNGTVLHTSSTHPFPLKNKGMAAICPNDQPEMSAMLGVSKLATDDILWSGQRFEYCENTETYDKLYNLILLNDLIYYVEDIACMTANIFICGIMSIAANDYKAIKDRDFVEQLQSNVTGEMKKEFVYKIYALASSWEADKYTKNSTMYFDFENLSRICCKLRVNRKEGIIKNVFDEIFNYELKSVNTEQFKENSSSNLFD